MFRYLVTTLRTAAFQQAVVPDHYTFLDHLRETGRIEIAGPFTDRSGGAYLLKADDLVEATALAHDDPLHKSGSSKVTVHEWDAR